MIKSGKGDSAFQIQLMESSLLQINPPINLFIFL